MFWIEQALQGLRQRLGVFARLTGAEAEGKSRKQLGPRGTRSQISRSRAQIWSPWSISNLLPVFVNKV